ncbi:MAG: TolC family protein [Bacteroidota bacterium]|nr:TolC family protein [Bacteroidota bacterium]MDW8136827.1 TolC family protein [Bacteroidota bacterium]
MPIASCRLRRGAIASGLFWFVFPIVQGPWAVTIACAQALRVLTEEDALVLFERHHPALQAQMAAVRAAEARSDQIAWPRPMLEAAAMPFMLASGMSGLSFMVRQMLPQSARLRAEREARLFEAQAATWRAAAERRTLRMRLRMALAELWMLGEQGRRIDALVEELHLFEQVALAQYASGRENQAAAIRVGLERQLWERRRRELAEQAAEKRAQLWELTGGALTLGPGDSVQLAPLPDSFSVSHEALMRHPMRQEAEAMVRTEEAMERAQRLMRRLEPTVGLGLNLSPEARRRLFGWEPLMPTVSLEIPLWRRPLAAQERERRAQLERKSHEAQALWRRLVAEAQAIRDQDRELRGLLRTLEEALIPRARLAWEAALAAYEGGRIRHVELLELRRMLLELELERIAAIGRRALLRARWLELVEKEPQS